MKRCELNGCALPERIRKSREREAQRKVERLGIARRAAAVSLQKNCRKRARTMGLEFALTVDDVEGMLVAAQDRCTVSGAPLNYGPGAHRRRPWFPSIDRRHCAYGYVRGNVRIVCVAVNLAMNEWGEDVLRRIAHYLVRKLAASDPNGRKAERFARDRRINFSRLSPAQQDFDTQESSIQLIANESD